ncbi:MAG TPA: cellulase (glycosyl hydrolase family 5) [Bacillota bacterium]|nr:cellulase (glycosyl hydrolase family 5) [Bacillota bacterium]
MESKANTGPLKRVYIEGNRFKVDGKTLWINGTNTPWNNWNDFGASFDKAWWDEHFALLNCHGINSVRIWISCDGQLGINIDEKGYVSGATDLYWAHLDCLFELAQKHQLYIMATTTSFDHCKNHHENFESWRRMHMGSDMMEAYIDNYLLPLVRRYKDNTALWSIDLCNEPDWINQNEECGQLPWSKLTEFYAKCTAAIHKESDILVTVGIGVVNNNHNVDDKAMMAYVGDEAACLDFYSPHHYPWMVENFGIPFGQTPEEYGAGSDKPAIIAEFAPTGWQGNSLAQDYESAFEKGWQGLMPWTSNGVDTCGDINDMKEALDIMINKHRGLIFP